MTPMVKLDRLTIEEISGVDEPANMLPGWLVTKAKGVPGSTTDHSAEAAIIDLQNHIKARILELTGRLETLGVKAEVEYTTKALTTLLNLIGDGSVEAEPAHKAALVSRANELLAEAETEKARRHDGRQHVGQDGNPATGKFQPMSNEPKVVQGPEGALWRIQDTRRHYRWPDPSSGKHEPSGGGEPDSGHAAYGEGGEGDPQGLRRKTNVNWLGGRPGGAS